MRARPLVQRWPALAPTLPPATGALHLHARQLPALRSFLAAPAIHAAAADDPELYGGRFVQLHPDRADEVRHLLADMVEAQSAQLELAAAIERLDARLRQVAGSPLEALYDDVPAPLRGCVELVYDREHRARFRLHEQLLYRRPVWDPRLHSIAFDRPATDLRPFSASTPVLADSDLLEVVAPFADNRWDVVFGSRVTPAPLGDLADALGLDGAVPPMALLSSPAPRPEQLLATRRARCVSHACVLVETAGTSLMVDPLVTTSRGTPGSLTIEDVPDYIEVALITHGHADHLCIETLLQLRSRIGTVVVPRSRGSGPMDPDPRLLLRAIGFRYVESVAEYEELSFGDITVIALPFTGEHGGLDIAAKLTYLVRVGRHSLLFAADTVAADPAGARAIREQFGSVSALFISMECEGAPMSWLYGPLLTGGIDPAHDRARRLAGSTPEQALAMARTLGCEAVFVYAMAMEPWLRHLSGRSYDETSLPLAAARSLIHQSQQAGLRSELVTSGWEEVLA